MTLVRISTPSTGVCQLSINRPEKRNALDDETRNSLTEAVEQALGDPSVRVVVLTGEGKNFCAGGDLEALQSLGLEAARRRQQHNHGLVRKLLLAEKPIVAAVNGFAMGAGAGLALCADFIVMGQGATLGFPFLKLGLVADFGVSYTLAARLGLFTARKILLRSENFKADDAVAVGIADEAVPDDELIDRSIRLASELSLCPPGAVGMLKRQIASHPLSLETAIELEALGQAMCLTGDEFKEALRTFREKRTPRS